MGRKKFSIKAKKKWKKFENNNEAVALNVLFSPSNIEEIKQVCISKHNSECKGKVLLLMITDGEKLHLTVKKLFALLRGITSRYNDSYYCINCLH